MCACIALVVAFWEYGKVLVLNGCLHCLGYPALKMWRDSRSARVPALQHLLLWECSETAEMHECLYCMSHLVLGVC